MRKFFFSQKFLLTLVLFIGVIQIAVYYVAGMLASNDGFLPVPQPDTLLYCQAARRIAEGFPFSFSAGEPVSTGTTSVLYPFVLALPYLLGAQGASLLSAGFWLNAAFYLIFLAGWSLAVFRWAVDGRVRLLAGVILALAAQPATYALSQSDTGLMMAISAVVAVGLACNRPVVWGIALFVSPWVRPEGMMCTLGVGLALVVRQSLSAFHWAERPRFGEWISLVFAVVSVFGVFALNFALTGRTQFSSVVNKGYFTNLPFATAVMSTFSTSCTMLRAYFFGLGTDGFYDYLAVPFFSGVAFLAGITSLCSDTRGVRWRMLAPLAVAAALSFAAVATSGWQGANFDRYLAWWQPIVYFFSAAGIVKLGQRIGGSALTILTLMVVGYNCMAAFAAVCCFNGNSGRTDRLLRFSQAIDANIPPGASVGGVTCNLAYMIGNRRYVNFSGLYSPGFQYVRRNDAATKIERLCHEKSDRPDYLVVENPETYVGFTDKEMDLMSSQVLVGPMGLELRKADWTLFDNSRVESLCPTGKTLVARIDVGFDPDERASRLEFVDRWNRSQGDPFVKVGKLDGRNIVDCGRVAIGKSIFHTQQEPHRDAVIVVRVTKRATAHLIAGLTKEKVEFRLSDVLAFDLVLNGKRVSHQHVHLPELADDDFFEFGLNIEGRDISCRKNVIEIVGDHNACEYRLYQ